MSATTVTARPTARRAVPTGALRKAALGLGFPIFVLIAWQILSTNEIIDPVLFPAPSSIFGTLGDRIQSGELANDLWATLSEVFVGYILSVIIGLPIGVAMGLWRRADYSIEPFVIGLYSAPTIALYPLFIIVTGIGFTTTVVLVVLFAIFPVIINTALGVRLVDQFLVRSAVSFGATRREVLRHVILPASLPSIAAGLELAIGRAITGAVVAELFIGSVGLGYSIGYYSSFLRLADVFLYIFILGILGVILRELMTALERRVRYENR
jgi:ABC-type nitrate/sulfonate/bicarbonate transport system permease component